MDQELKRGLPTYARSWNEFLDRAMPILIQNPSEARYTLKFVPSRNIFVLKVIDGPKLVMKRCHANEQFEDIEKFTKLVARALTGETELEKQEPDADKGNKDNKKKKKKK